MADELREAALDAFIERSEIADTMIEHAVRTGHVVSLFTLAYGRTKQKTILCCSECDEPVFNDRPELVINPKLSTWVQKVRQEIDAAGG